MAMHRPADTVELGKFVLFITSTRTPASTKCLVMAHGALVGSFVQTPVRLHFFVRNGVTLQGGDPLNLVLTLQHQNEGPAESVDAGGYFQDLALSKLLGRGGEDHTYDQLADAQRAERVSKRDWQAPHIALVRHRHFRSKTVLLSELIRLVTQHNANIADIHVAACRPYVRAAEGERVGVDEFEHIPGRNGRRGVVVGWHRTIR